MKFIDIFNAALKDFHCYIDVLWLHDSLSGTKVVYHARGSTRHIGILFVGPTTRRYQIMKQASPTGDFSQSLNLAPFKKEGDSKVNYNMLEDYP